MIFTRASRDRRLNGQGRTGNHRMVHVVVCLLALVLPILHADEPASHERYVQASVQPAGSMSRGEFRRLRVFEIPGEASADQIERTRQNILKTGRFASVSVRVVERPKGKELVFAVETRPYMRTFRIRGNRQISDRALKKAMDLGTYMAADDQALETAERRLKDQYELLGFPRPDVAVEIDDRSARGLSVRFRIDETPLPSADGCRLALEGNPGIWTRLRLRTRWWLFGFRLNRMGFNAEAIESQMKAYTKQLHETGYLDSTWHFDAAFMTGQADVSKRITLDAGKPSVIRMKNVGFFESRRITDAWRRRNHSLGDRELARLSRSAVKALRGKGYLDASAAVAVETWQDKTLLAVTADPGPRYYTSRIELAGNAIVPDTDIRRVLPIHEPAWYRFKSWVQPDTIRTASDTLLGYYRSLGFSEVTVDGRSIEGTGDGMAIRFDIAEGERKTVGSVRFSGARSIEERVLKSTFAVRKGDPFDWSRLRLGLDALRRLYQSRGFMDVSVEVLPGESIDGNVPVVVAVEENAAHTIDALLVEGNFKTASSVVFDAAHLGRGDPYDLEPLADLQQRLYELDLFDSVAIRPEPSVTGNESVGQTVAIAVRERPTGYFEGGIDINTDRGLELMGKIGDRNLFGKAISGSLSSLAGPQRNSTSLALSQPNIFGSRLDPFLNASYTDDRTQSGFSEAITSLGAGVSRRFSKALRATFEYTYERRTAFDVAADVAGELDYENGRIAAFIPGISYDSRDDMFFPRTGSLVFARLKSSMDFLGGSMRFQRLECGVRHYEPLGTYASLAFALRGGRIWSLSSDLPLGERFFLGGANSHRGFHEQDLGPLGSDDHPLGGQTYWLANAEARFPLFRKLSAGVFIDAGNTFLTEPEPPYVRPAAGFGLRLDTPVGPIRADLGYNLDRRDGEDPMVFHLAIGHAF